MLSSNDCFAVLLLNEGGESVSCWPLPLFLFFDLFCFAFSGSSLISVDSPLHFLIAHFGRSSYCYVAIPTP